LHVQKVIAETTPGLFKNDLNLNELLAVGKSGAAVRLTCQIIHSQHVYLSTLE